MVQNNISRRIQVQGIVQGVGFRPFVYEQAVKNHLTGWVRNSSSGVEIEINGAPDGIENLISALSDHLPPLARVDTLQVTEIQPEFFPDFQILSSQPQPGEYIPISPDIAICGDCQNELFDPKDRRYRYPFINCTNCGPRFTIIEDIPYDRPLTTMKGFPLCPQCTAEYKNPLDRRFHAQPIACPDCGPQLSFIASGKEEAAGEEALQLARKWIRQGKIVAVKGLGGYHLACDARNEAAVASMRNRKKRSDKPFALMAFDLASIKSACDVSGSEEVLLLSRQKPVVLLNQKPANGIAPSVAPGLDTLGIMLPYTPLHLLLLEPEAGYPDLLVMTSGNMSEEPIAYIDEDGFRRLQPIADAFLNHDRPIHMRVDDSVVREERGKIYPIRRARGYAPDAVTLAQNVLQVLATGALLKNTFCLTRDKYAFISHHIGDLENYETYRSFKEGIAHYQNLFRITPERVVCDLHPDYLSTRFALEFSQEHQLPVMQVQHHHAHLASVIAENHLPVDEKVIGLCFDGTGYGTDGRIWGGEVLVGNCRNYLRYAHLAYQPLPGGDAAIHHPARIALAYLWNEKIDWDELTGLVNSNLCSADRTILLAQLQNSINTPQTSSMGRLFDAVSALTGICTETSYEAQAAILLEVAANPAATGHYPMPLTAGVWEIEPLLQGIIADLYHNVSKADIAGKFHNSIALAAIEVCETVRAHSGCSVAALSGGVWQNRLLLRKTVSGLKSKGFTVLTHHQVPSNDGGLSLGQAWIAANAEFNGK